MSKTQEALKLALEALEESLEYVQEEAENAQRLYGQYPTRQARIQGLKDDARKHMNAITAIREALAEEAHYKKVIDDVQALFEAKREEAAIWQAAYETEKGFREQEKQELDDLYAERKETVLGMLAYSTSLETELKRLREEQSSQKRPQNRGTGYCSCIECLFEQPAQEPVAWRTKNAAPPGGYVVFQQYPQAVANLGGAIEPLYTSPQPSKPLTDERAKELWDQSRCAIPRYLTFKTLVEAEHGIKK